jgi:lambda family phage minor tail protein L
MTYIGPNLNITKEGLLNNPSTLISLYELDGTSIGLSTIYRFYDGSNNNYKPLTFNGVEYTPFPIKVEGLDYDGKGSLPRGTLTVSNINGFVSSLLLENRQLNRAKFSRIRVYARFIDNVNFSENLNPYGTPDPTAAFEADIFFINRKISENKDIVSFELVTSLEVQDVKLPNRSILANICPFKFRDSTSCGYAGTPISDSANKLFQGGAGTYGFTLVDKGQWSAATTYNQGDYTYIVSTLPQTLNDKLYYVCNVNGTVGSNSGPLINPNLWIGDVCTKSIAGCKLHFSTGPLPGGFFPGVTRGAFQITT